MVEIGHTVCPCVLIISFLSFTNGFKIKLIYEKMSNRPLLIWSSVQIYLATTGVPSFDFQFIWYMKKSISETLNRWHCRFQQISFLPFGTSSSVFLIAAATCMILTSIPFENIVYKPVLNTPTYICTSTPSTLTFITFVFVTHCTIIVPDILILLS